MFPSVHQGTVVNLQRCPTSPERRVANPTLADPPHALFNIAIFYEGRPIPLFDIRLIILVSEPWERLLLAQWQCQGLHTGHTTLLRRWISVIDVDSTSQERRVPMQWDIYIRHLHCALQYQKTVTFYFLSNQLLPFGFAEYYSGPLFHWPGGGGGLVEYHTWFTIFTSNKLLFKFFKIVCVCTHLIRWIR